MITVGIDPGNTGAFAFFNDGRLTLVVDMPLMANGKKQQVNSVEVANILERMRPDLAILEKVHAMPKQGVTSCFNFGMGYGAIQGAIAALKIPIILVTPQAWKKQAGLLKKDKDNARTLAQQLFPDASLSRKKDIGRADAILIGKYGTEI